MDSSIREKIKLAIKLNGGIRAVSREANVNAGNLSMWLKDSPTFSEEKIDLVLAAIGLQGLLPNKDQVLRWNIGMIDQDILDSISLYFPNELKIVALRLMNQTLHSISFPWDWGWENEKERIQIGEMYLLEGEGVRAILSVKFGLGELVQNKSVVIENRDISISYKDYEFCKIHETSRKNLTVKKFDEIYNEDVFPFPQNSMRAVLDAIYSEGITYEEAAKRIKKKN